MRYLILDLETAPLAEAAHWFDPVKPDARLKDADKIKASIEEKTADRNDKFGLNPDTCKIVAIGTFVVGADAPTVDLCRDEAEEREALIRFWALYRAVAHTKLVTFYGSKFDLPVLRMRSVYLGVDAAPLVIGPPWKSPHIDVYQDLTCDGARKDVGSLAFYGRRCGFTTLDKVNGADIAQLVAEGRWDAVRAHCESDVSLTHALANKLGLLRIV